MPWRWPISSVTSTAAGRRPYRGKKLSPYTLKKEISTFRAAWNWAAHMGIVKGAFPSRGLVYPKTDEKPPFMTRQEIERGLTAKLSDAERAELWECLYLTKPEVEELLAFVKVNAAHDWIYPLFCFACHTGARPKRETWPTYFLIDKTGKVVWGFANNPPSAARIEELLKR